MLHSSRHISVLIRIHTNFALGLNWQWASQFNCTYRYIDYVLLINNPDLKNYIGQMSSTEVEIKDREQHFRFLFWFIPVDWVRRSAAHFRSWQACQFQLQYHKMSFPEKQYSILSSPLRFISQFKRYARACYSCECFILWTAGFSNTFKLIEQR